MYRMRQREFILGLIRATLDLRQSLLELTNAHRDTIFAVHTHTQRAQPTTVAHYLLAVLEQLERDTIRLRAAYENTNRNPLGSCAITGTGFDIDRNLTADCSASADQHATPTAASPPSITCSKRPRRRASCWSDWDALSRICSCGRPPSSTTCVSGDGFVQCSSIMPQKRNPVAFEHARAIGSKALGQSQAIVTSVHNTPFGDIVDTEDDLQPLVFSMFP
jgi:argininosuccinate lyase